MTRLRQSRRVILPKRFWVLGGENMHGSCYSRQKKMAVYVSHVGHMEGALNFVMEWTPITVKWRPMLSTLSSFASFNETKIVQIIDLSISTGKFWMVFPGNSTKPFCGNWITERVLIIAQHNTITLPHAIALKPANGCAFQIL